MSNDQGGHPQYPGPPAYPGTPVPPQQPPAYPGAAAPGYPQSTPGAPGYGQQQYGQQQYAQPYGAPYVTPLKSNGLALTSMICGIVGMVFFWIAYLVIPFLAAIAAVVTGHMALGKIKRDAQLGGKGMAITGLVLGYVGIVLNLLVAGLMIFAFVMAASYSNSGY